MDKETERAINVLLGKVTDGITADEALKYTQAVVNLANSACARKNTGPTR